LPKLSVKAAKVVSAMFNPAGGALAPHSFDIASCLRSIPLQQEYDYDAAYGSYDHADIRQAMNIPFI
jgi:hypothetical protein